MHIVVSIFLFLHGAIHLHGFFKGDKLVDGHQFNKTLSQRSRMCWLIVSILFVLAAVLFLFNSNWWLLPGTFAIIGSQILIVYAWRDAKFGTIANTLILVLLVIGYGTWSFQRTYRQQVKKEIKQSVSSNGILSETDLLELPVPVQKYLRCTKSVGKPYVHSFKVSFHGKIRKNAQSSWMLFRSEQHNFLETPVRLFFMKARVNQMPVAGYHCFMNGKA